MKKIIALALMLFSLTAVAGDRYHRTNSGLITLTNEPCALEFIGKDKHDYKRAYAIRDDGQDIPEGCWYFDEQVVKGQKVWSISIYVPSLDVTFVYNPELFTTTKPEVRGQF